MYPLAKTRAIIRSYDGYTLLSVTGRSRGESTKTVSRHTRREISNYCDFPLSRPFVRERARARAIKSAEFPRDYSAGK